MDKIQFRLAARTDAAGKYNAEAPLEGNEDNMFIDDDLTNEAQNQFMADKLVDLSEKGCLMVVADGMGGMNAGEVASDIAIKTVTEYFKPEHLKEKSFRDSRARIKYMEDVVVAADAAIKSDSRSNKEHEGMGSTIIMAWLCDNEICLTWCGDSRAYLYRPNRGFWQVSKDHSYVQGLVDEGKITMDEAFDHPYGNIITRSLGDPEKKAKPDSVTFDVYEGDVFMLCSDGLSGVLRDHKTYMNGQRVDSENLEDIIGSNLSSMAQCRDALFDAAQRNEWYDNVTVILCEITQGVPQPSDLPQPVRQDAQAGSTTQAPNPVQHEGDCNIGKRKPQKILPIIIAAAVLLLGAIGLLIWKYLKSDDTKAYERCKEYNDVGDYRYYQKHYSNGAHIDSVNAWLDRWVQDSTQKAGSIIPEDSKVDNNAGLILDGKDIKEDKKEKNKSNVVPAKDNKMDMGNENQKQNLATPDPVVPPAVDTITGGEVNRPNPIKIKPESESKIKKDSIVNKIGGLTPDNPKDEEDAFNKIYSKQAPSLEDYLFYLNNYDETINKDHHAWVVNKFIKLYGRKLNSCNTYEECQQFLNEHDSIMARAKMKGGRTDKTMRERAEAKLNELRPRGGSQKASNNHTYPPKPNSVKPSPLK